MKYILFNLLLLITHIGLSMPENIGVLDLTVVSDTVDDGITSETAIVEGNVKNVFGASPFENVRVGTNSNEVLSDSLGNFELIVQVTDTVFYCYTEGWSEIYVLNPGFESQHRLVVDVVLREKNVLMRKPVIYLYGEPGLEVDLSLTPKGDFTFTYPAYNNGWSVSLGDNGGIIDQATDKTYPYLFWEAETDLLSFDNAANSFEGWIIKTDTVVQFLENQLTYLGLNSTEQTDFITFWAPILEQRKYALMQFLIDDSYETNIASLAINPTPDAMRRVYLLSAPLSQPNTDISMIGQEFEPFEREGFTVLEWGGSSLNQ